MIVDHRVMNTTTKVKERENFSFHKVCYFLKLRKLINYGQVR